MTRDRSGSGDRRRTGFFDTLRIPLLYGRVFDARDRADTPRVAVITDGMARQYFGAVNAVGRRFRLQNDPNSWTEVIGVVRDTGTGDFDDDVLDPIAPPFYRSTSSPARCRRRSSRGRRAMRHRLSRRCSASCAPWTSRCR